MKKWTAIEFDITRKIVAEAKPAHIKIPAGLKWQIIVEIDDALYAKFVKDASWIQKIQQKARSKALPYIAHTMTAVRQIDADAATSDPKRVAVLIKSLNAGIERDLATAGKAVAADVELLVNQYGKGQSELRTFRVKAGAIIALKSVEIGITTAGAVASHGALAPLAIVSIAKNSVRIAHECAKLALSADGAAELVKAEFAILKTFMTEDLGKAKLKGVVAQGAKEAALNVMAGILGVPVPSLALVTTHIGVHKVGIAKLESTSHGISAGLYKAMDEQADWNKRYQAAKRGISGDKVTMIEPQLAKVEKALHLMIESIVTVKQGYHRCKAASEGVRESLSRHEGQPSFAGFDFDSYRADHLDRAEPDKSD